MLIVKGLKGKMRERKKRKHEVGPGGGEDKSFTDIFLFSVDGPPLIHIKTMLLEVPHQSSLDSGAISAVSCEWVTRLCHLVNHTRSRGDAQRARASAFLQLFQRRMVIPLPMFCSFWEFKNNLPNEAALSSSCVKEKPEATSSRC